MAVVFHNAANRVAVFLLALAPGATLAAHDHGTLATVFTFDGKKTGGPAYGGTVADGTILYGTTQGNGQLGKGPNKLGTLWKFDTTTGTLTTLHAFGGTVKHGPDGAFPNTTPVLSGNILYGTTQYGGAHGTGTIYRYDLTAGTETIVASLPKYMRGWEPGDLALGGDELFGATREGGDFNQGTLYKVSIKTGKVRVLHSFGAAGDGQDPDPPIFAGGMVYGYTENGGASGFWGTLFAVDPHTGAESIVHSFMGAPDGGTPVGRPFYDHGLLYGTTTSSGPMDQGTLHSIDVNTGAFTDLYDFPPQFPVQARNVIVRGKDIYGFTQLAGKYRYYGQVFKFSQASSRFVTLCSFNAAVPPHTASPRSMTIIGDVIYGTVYGGAYVDGDYQGGIYACTPE